MRAFLILAAVVALPVLVMAHRQYFFATQQPLLLSRVMAALDDPKFKGIDRSKLGPNYLDVTLEGKVADPEARLEAQKRVAAVRGVRCTDEHNLLVIPARLGAKFAGELLTLSGWLRDERSLGEFTGWLEAARPGLQVESSQVKFSPYVTLEDTPPPVGTKDLPAILGEAWNAIRARAFLRVDKSKNLVRARGTLPTLSLRASIMEALLAPVADTELDVKELRAGAFVKSSRFADEEALPAFLRSFFRTPGAESFEADGDTVKIKASATPVMEQEWRELLQAIAERHTIAVDVHVYPSTLMFPKYRPLSELEPQALEDLVQALGTTTISFDYGEFTTPQPQLPKIATVALAVLAAGPGARIVAAAYPDAEGNARDNLSAAQKRLDYLIDDLKRRGVPDKQIEGLVLPVCPAPDGSDLSRSIVFLVR